MQPDPEDSKGTLTKLIGTLGPACESVQALQGLLEKGLRVRASANIDIFTVQKSFKVLATVWMVSPIAAGKK
jgi:pyruvate kinase